MKHTEYTLPTSYTTYMDPARPAQAHMSALRRTADGSTAVLLQNQSLPPGAKAAVAMSVGTPHPFFAGPAPGAPGARGDQRHGPERRRAEVRRSAPTSGVSNGSGNGGGILKPSSSSSHLDRRALALRKNVNVPLDHHRRGVRHSAPIPLTVANVLPNGLGIVPGMSMSLPAGIPNPGPNGVVYIGVIVDDPRRHPADAPGPRRQMQSPPQLLPLFHQQQQQHPPVMTNAHPRAYRQSMPVYLHSSAAPQPSYAAQSSPGPVHPPHGHEHEYQAAAPYYIPAVQFPTPTPRRLEDDSLSVRSVPRSLPRPVSQPLTRPVHPFPVSAYPPPPTLAYRANTHSRHMSLPPSESESESERRMMAGVYLPRPASTDVGDIGDNGDIGLAV